MDVVIRGIGTSFKSGQTTLDFGPGINIQRLDVTNTETMVARIQIDPSALPGSHDLNITTNGQVVLKQGAFVVNTIGGDFQASLNIVPTQSLHVSDFDPKNLANSPLLFTVNIHNDATPRNVAMYLTISCDQYGDLGTAYRLVQLTANQIYTFDNRQFDKYNLTDPNSPIIQLAIKTGSLPADVYHYKLVIIDRTSGATIQTLDGQNVISNPMTRPELIGPGNNFTTVALNITTKTPVFNWFSPGNNFELSVYEVPNEKTAPEEVLLTRPIFTQKDLTTSYFVYPASAKLLEDGKLYAWQIKANYVGTQGTQTLQSEVYWFRMATPGTSPTSVNKTVTDMKVEPEEFSVNPNQAFAFHVKAYNSNGDTLSINPAWRVVPADAGTINNSGVFTAGSKPNSSVAIVAIYGDMQDYATVSINAQSSGGSSSMLDEAFLKKLFGIPDSAK
jgi:hypothetical protein